MASHSLNTHDYLPEKHQVSEGRRTMLIRVLGHQDSIVVLLLHRTDSNRTVLSDDHYHTISIADVTCRARRVLVGAVDGVSGLIPGRLSYRWLLIGMGRDLERC